MKKPNVKTTPKKRFTEKDWKMLQRLADNSTLDRLFSGRQSTQQNQGRSSTNRQDAPGENA